MVGGGGDKILNAEEYPEERDLTVEQKMRIPGRIAEATILYAFKAWNQNVETVKS